MVAFVVMFLVMSISSNRTKPVVASADLVMTSSLKSSPAVVCEKVVLESSISPEAVTPVPDQLCSSPP